MQHIRSKDTMPERIVAKELRKRKIYFSRHVAALIGKPDFVFRRKRVAVFIDSDFWHGHPKRFIMPQSNLDYWQQKIKRNKARDQEVTKALKNEGWKVLRIWENDVKKKFDRIILKILKAIGRGG